MAPLAYLPNIFGLIVWNLINAFVFLFAIWKLSFKYNRLKVWIVSFVLLAFISSLQTPKVMP